MNKITWVGSVLVGDTRKGEVQHARVAEQLNHSVSRPNLEKFENILFNQILATGATWPVV